MALIEKETEHVNSSMDNIRTDSGLSGRSVSGTLQTSGAGESQLIQVKRDTENMMSGFKDDSLSVLARKRVLPAEANEHRGRLHKWVELTRAENGWLSCQMTESRCDSTELILLQPRSSEDDLKALFVTDRIRKASRLAYSRP